MKVLFINGSPNQFGCTQTALSEVERVINSHGIQSETLYLGKKPIAGCIACMSCKKNGFCMRDGIVKNLQEKLHEYSAIVIGSPVYFSGPTGQLVSFLNRLFFASGSNMRGKIGAAVVSCRRGGASATFEQINQYFAISNMQIATSQYWNSVHGLTPDDVLKDHEGLQTMRALGANIAYMLKLKELAENKGISPNFNEQQISTNFI